MSYSFPFTRTTGAVITSAIWNQDVRDNREFMHNRNAALVYRTTNQTITNNTNTFVAWDAEVFDNNALHSAASPEIVRGNVVGVYFLHAMIKFASGVAGTRKISIVVSLTEIAVNSMRVSTTTETEMSVSCIYHADASINAFRVYVLQVTGGNLDIVSDGTFVPRFGIQWIGSGA